MGRIVVTTRSLLVSAPCEGDAVKKTKAAQNAALQIWSARALRRFLPTDRIPTSTITLFANDLQYCGKRRGAVFEAAPASRKIYFINNICRARFTERLSAR